MIGEFASGRPASGRGPRWPRAITGDGFGHEWAEINGAEGSAVYRLHEPNTILLGKTGHDLAPVAVPTEYLKPAGSPARPGRGGPGDRFPLRPHMGVYLGDPANGVRAVPSFYDGFERPVGRRRGARVACTAEVG